MQELVDKQLYRRALTVPTSEFPHCCESTLRPFLITYGSSSSANPDVGPSCCCSRPPTGLQWRSLSARLRA